MLNSWPNNLQFLEGVWLLGLQAIRPGRKALRGLWHGRMLRPLAGGGRPLAKKKRENPQFFH